MSSIINLFILALPVACVSWTITHEAIFAEIHDYCVKKSKKGKSLFSRKFFYLFTCEYCFSHYVAIAALLLTHYTILFTDWRGSVFAFFALVWIANMYMNLFFLIRIDIKKDGDIAKEIEKNL